MNYVVLQHAPCAAVPSLGRLTRRHPDGSRQRKARQRALAFAQARTLKTAERGWVPRLPVVVPDSDFWRTFNHWRTSW